MPIVRIVAYIVNAHVDQASLAGALKYAGLKVWGEDFWQEGKDLELHGGILAY